MLAAVNFNNQARFMAGKIDDVSAERNLPAKMRIGKHRKPPQTLPKLMFRIGGISAHVVRELMGMRSNRAAVGNR